MKRVWILPPVLAAVGLLFAGCFFSLKPAKPKITDEELALKQRASFVAPYDRVWDAALVALATQKMGEVDKESGLISTREQNVSGQKMEELAWDPSYGSFWYYENSKALDDARYWINVKVSKITDDTTRVQITPNFEVHIREWPWDSTSQMVWKRVRSRGVIEDAIVERIAKELEQ